MWRRPPRHFLPVREALRDLERLTTEADGLVLRLGHFYGPGTIYAPDGSFVRQIHAGKVPIVGEGKSMFSFVHTEDIAAAIQQGLGKDVTGILNVVDDDPTPIGEWLPALARRVDAPQTQTSAGCAGEIGHRELDWLS
jgi:nucleoside-diphosphate-sugar epimerase